VDESLPLQQKAIKAACKHWRAIEQYSSEGVCCWQALGCKNYIFCHTTTHFVEALFLSGFLPRDLFLSIDAKNIRSLKHKNTY